MIRLAIHYEHIGSWTSFFFLFSNFGGKDSDSSRKNVPSAKEHYMKQARYFPGQSPGAANKMPGNRKSSVSMGLNASYLPSFQKSHTQSRLGGAYALGGTSGNSVGRLIVMYIPNFCCPGKMAGVTQKWLPTDDGHVSSNRTKNNYHVLI